MTTPSPQWKKTACILCSLNCGLEVQTENGRISKIRGDDDHPASQGYVCEKSQRMDYYQNGADRLDTPMRRRPDGSYEAIDWDTAIREVAEKFLAIKRRHGGESILYYGGGAQGNHLGGAYGDSTLKALGVKYRSNALAQEKTGEFWVQGKMFGTGVHGDFEHCEVAILIGKNPWQSHGFARARVLLNAMAKDPARSIIVIDPRLSETAALADFHLQIRPGTDAWCLAALVGIIVQDGLLARDWLAEHTSGYEHIVDELNAIPVAYCAETCGVAEDKLRAAARRIASASSVSALEDLGMQMNLHSTLGSYLQRLVWLLTGHYGRPGTSNAFVPFLSLSKASKGDTSMGKKGAPRVEKRSPVANAKIIIGLIPCNVIPEEILTDHPKRYRAMLVETGNPLHSLADSQRMREAMRALELSVVIDVAMTETARHADYVLPAASQFEKAEATFFMARLAPTRPGEWLEHSPLLIILLVLLAGGWLVHEFSTKPAILAISGLNTYNLLFLMLGALLHWRPRSFLDAVARAVPTTTGVLIQFPLYGSIAAIMTTVNGSDGETLAHHISTFFVQIASHDTYALLMGVYSAVLGFFIPSGGGKWIIEAPYVMQVANELQYHLGWAVQIYNAAEALPNLINPFYMLPLLGVLGLKARDLIGFSFVQLLVHIPLVLVLLWALGSTLAYIPPVMP